MATKFVDVSKIYKTCTSFSHTLGNMTSIIESYIKSQMPPNYFKHTYKTTEAAFKSLKDLLANKAIVPEKPFLTIDPKFLTDTETEALPWMHWDKAIATDHLNSPKFYLFNSELFLKHITPDFKFGYTFNRYRLNFGITMLVDSQMKRLSLINYLRSEFRFKHPFPITRYIETMIPKSYIQYAATTLGMDIASEAFLSELNNHSDYPIVRMFRPATGLIEFFIMRQGDIQLRLPDYPTEDSVKSGRIEKYSSVQFNIEVEFNAINNIILISPEPVTVDDTDMTSEYTYRFTIDGQTPLLENAIGTMQLYTKLLVKMEHSKEELDLTRFMSDEQKQVLKYTTANNITTKYLTVKVYKGLTEVDLSDATLGKIDYTTMQLTLLNLDMDLAYTIAIYCDTDFVRKMTEIITENDPIK